MSQNRPQFLRVFQKGIEIQHENIDPLTHSLPPIQYTLNQKVAEMLEKIRDSISMMTAIGFNGDFFTTVRKMMLLDTISQESPSKMINYSVNELYLSSKIEIVPSQPVEWIYGQLKLIKEDNDGSLSPIRLNSRDLLEQKIGISILATILASSTLIIEIVDSQSLNQISTLLKETQQKVNDLPNVFPKIFAVITSKNQNQNEFQSQISILRNRNINVELITNKIAEGWEEEYRLMSIGKSIIGNLRPKVIGKVAVTAKLLQFLWFALANSGDSIVPLSIWQTAQTELIQQHSEQALQQYMSRIDDITQGQQFLSQSFFKEAEIKVRSDVLKQVSQRAGFTPESQNILKTQRRLLEWKEELQCRNSRGVQDWGKQFLKEAWSLIQKKIGKEIKSIFGLRQQILILFEFFKKKSEVFISADLVLNFIEFLLPKLFDSALTITTSIVTPLQEQQMTLQTQIMSLATEAKDLRKRANREENQLSRRMQQQRQKYLQLQSNYSVSEKCLDIAKKELQEIRQNYEQKILEMEQEYQKVLKEKNKQMEQMVQKMDQGQKQRSFLESELNKEKLLHEQTRHFYDQTVELLKSREVQARTEFEEMSLSASRELHVMRATSTKEQDDYQNNTSELLRKTLNQEQLLIERDEAIQKMKKELQFMQDRVLDFDSLTTKINELELRNKILEDMQNDCELLRNRNRKVEQQLKRYIRERQQQNEFCRQSQTKALVFQERYVQLNEQIQLQRTKVKDLITDIQQLHLQRQQIQNKLIVYSSKIMVDASYQAQDSTVKQNLLLALETINELQADYNKVKAEYEWHRRFRS